MNFINIICKLLAWKFMFSCPSSRRLEASDKNRESIDALKFNFFEKRFANFRNYKNVHRKRSIK